MGFKARNNANTTGIQWKEKYYSKDAMKQKKWARKHYDEIYGTYVQWRDSFSPLIASLSEINYKTLLEALEYACNTLKGLFEGNDPKTVVWDDLARTWNASILVKRFIAGKTERKELKNTAKELSGVVEVYYNKLKF